ncbi:MAG: hypothetical protein ACPGJV_07930 [Bacteriovoracaceae bacterium]
MQNTNTRLFISALFFILVYIKPSYSEIRPQSTTRLVSTGGTGVGSILLEEAIVLNPASIAFFRDSSFFYQKNKLTNLDTDQKDGDSFSIIAADAKGSFKGAAGFHKDEDGETARQKISGAMASAVSENSSFGLNFNYIKDTELLSGNSNKESYKNVNLGVTHIVSPDFTLGVVIEDVTQSDPFEDDIILGAQYIFKKHFMLMADIGSLYKSENLNQNFLYRMALQIQFLSDFYLRGGFSRKRTSVEERTSGLGVSWVQPKLSFDLAYQNVETYSIVDSSVQAQNLRSTSFSFSYRF